ncbi:MAG TPA: methyltransferase [Candidatus Udaeobacter sp.]|nr:methyltransferase [Candidatus Udaeobacter sp.]
MPLFRLPPYARGFFTARNTWANIGGFPCTCYALPLCIYASQRFYPVLKNCRRAMTKTAKLLVIEMVIPPGNEASYSKLLDLMMLVGPGGCDRTEAEYEALFQAGGFKLTKVIPTQSPASVIEGIPE